MIATTSTAAANLKRTRPRPYRKTGFHGIKTALSQGGLSVLDGRSAGARAIERWKAEIEGDLGSDLTTAERTLLEAAAGDLALLAVADSWLREHAEQVVNKRHKAFVPLVAERARVAAHLADLLRTLGLKRRARPVPTLAQILATMPTQAAAQTPAVKILEPCPASPSAETTGEPGRVAPALPRDQEEPA